MGRSWRKIEKYSKRASKCVVKGRERASERARAGGRDEQVRRTEGRKAGDVEKDETEDEIEYIHEREIER